MAHTVLTLFSRMGWRLSIDRRWGHKFFAFKLNMTRRIISGFEMHSEGQFS